MTNTQSAAIFAPKGNKKVQEVQGGDPWADTPFLAPGLTSDKVQEAMSEGREVHKIAWEKGQTIAGIFNGLKTKKNPPARGAKQYGVFTSEDGQKFRVDAPGQLAYILTSLTEGEYVQLRYEGLEYVESVKSECHQFTLLKEPLN